MTTPPSTPAPATPVPPAVARSAIRNNRFEEAPEGGSDYDLLSSNQLFGPHVNLIPIQSAVSGSRVFYGAHFMVQALPLTHREAPLVQQAMEHDPQGRSFDNVLGVQAGAVRSRVNGKVHAVEPHRIILKDDQGEEHEHELLHQRPLNRKTIWHNTPQVKVGDPVKVGDLLADSNFTDKKGTLAVGANARIGLVPFKGWSMDDSVVVSDSFAKRMQSEGLYGHDMEYKKGVEGGKNKYRSLFPETYTQEQLEGLDDDGVIKVGQKVNPGDPLILAHHPKILSPTSKLLGNLSSHMRKARTDVSVNWDHSVPGVVTHVHRLPSGVKVNVAGQFPLQVADKLTLRNGQKGTVSKIIPDEHMLRGVDGQPLEVLLNPLGIPSRINNGLVYELLLGKVANKKGQPYVLPAFLKPGEKWHEFVDGELKKHGLNDTEEVFDPQLNHRLENPITTGFGYIQKLHHTAESKFSARGQGSYGIHGNPAKGPGEGQQSKRLSGLEVTGLLSAGAYGVLRDAATLRGARNDDYWRKLRMNVDAPPPGSPLAWHKLRALLHGSGYYARAMGKGQERLQFWTDKDLAKMDPVHVKHGEIVDLNTLEPIEGGLFDRALLGSNKYGYMKLPAALPNPAAETALRKLLGLTQKQFDGIMAGEMELPEHLRTERKDQGVSK